jgi:hypothetical protein
VKARFDTPNDPTHNRRAHPKGDPMSAALSIAGADQLAIATIRTLRIDALQQASMVPGRLAAASAG